MSIHDPLGDCAPFCSAERMLMPPLLIVCKEVDGERVLDVNVEDAVSCGLCGIFPHLVTFQDDKVVWLCTCEFAMPPVVPICICPKWLRLCEFNGIVADASTELKCIVVVQESAGRILPCCSQHTLKVF